MFPPGGLQSIKISVPPLLSHLSGVTNSYLKPPGGAESAVWRVLGASQSVRWGIFPSQYQQQVQEEWRSQVIPAETQQGFSPEGRCSDKVYCTSSMSMWQIEFFHLETWKTAADKKTDGDRASTWRKLKHTSSHSGDLVMRSQFYLELES